MNKRMVCETYDKQDQQERRRSMRKNIFVYQKEINKYNK
jgi:hypothetical protein